MKIITKNRHKADCGVVAAFNAASWCRKYKTYDHIHELALNLGYCMVRGIKDHQFRRLLNKLCVPFKRIRQINLDEIQSRLYLGKCMVVTYYPVGWPHGHLVTIYMNRKGQIRVINPDEQRMTWNDFASQALAGAMERMLVYELTSDRNLAL